MPHSPSDITTTLKQSPNLNATLKTFLKREVKKGDPAERFIKDLKKLFLAPEENILLAYLEKHAEKNERCLLALAGYAHISFVAPVSDKVVDQFAEEFNTTYEVSAGIIKLKNKDRFKAIAKESLRIIDEELSKSSFANSLFMKDVVSHAIFDDVVLQEIRGQ